MPLKWDAGQNPYVHNFFGRLAVGPNVLPTQIVEQAKNLQKKITAGHTLELAGQILDEHAISEASKELRQPRSLAEELLLVHPQGERQGKKSASHVEKLRQVAVPSIDSSVPSLVHPVALFWFTPYCGPETMDLPEWNAFDLIAPDEALDTDLDIIFDM